MKGASQLNNHLKFCGRDQVEAFWKFVSKQEGCWPWKGALHRDGYGRFNLPCHGGMVIAHRFAWKMTYGEIPDGMHVLHRCDNPPCCNPEHMWLGTHRENMDDRSRKGRYCGGKLPRDRRGGEFAKESETSDA